METYVHGTEVETQDAEVLWGGKKVSIRPPQIPREMQWDRNFSPFNILHEYVVCFPYIETEFQNIL